MLVLPQKVEVKWNNRNREWYESKGYEFTKIGDKFETDVENLQLNSAVKVEVICDFCKDKITKRYADYHIGRKTSDKDSCNKCRNIKGGISKVKYTYEDVKGEFEKRGFTLLEYEYLGFTEHHKYICDNKHECSITFKNLLKGRGCKKCATNVISNIRRNNIDDVRKEFNDKGCTLLTNDYKHSKQKLEYICKCGNIDRKSLTHFRRGQRCPICSGSIGEKRIFDFLSNNNLKFISEYTFENCKNVRVLQFDFAVFDNNELYCLIEYDGIQHFEPVEYFGGKEKFKSQIENDIIKNTYCEQNNIKLIRIPYFDLDNIEYTLESKLIKLLDNTERSCING